MRLVYLTLLFGLASAPNIALADTSGEIEIGESLPEATMRGLNGPPKKLSAYRGRPLLINVWASWCGPCRAEMGSLERLAWLDQSGYFSVIGVSTDDSSERAHAFLKASNATITHFIDTRLHIESMLGATRLPLTVLVDADGRVIEKIYGAKKWDGPYALTLIRNAFDGQPTHATRVTTTNSTGDLGR